MGVKLSHPNSVSIFLLLKLSTITTSCPWSLKYKEVGQPQNPSPPRTMTFFLSEPLTPFASAWRAKVDALGAVKVREEGTVNAVVSGRVRKR